MKIGLFLVFSVDVHIPANVFATIMWLMLCDINVLFSMYTFTFKMPVLCFTINDMKPPVSVSWICGYLKNS